MSKFQYTRILSLFLTLFLLSVPAFSFAQPALVQHDPPSADLTSPDSMASITESYLQRSTRGSILRKVSRRGKETLITQGTTDFNPSYPRIGIFHFGKAPADWYAKFDLVMSNNDSSYSALIKAINPAAIVLPTHGWTAYGSPSRYIVAAEDFDEGAYLVDESNGQDLYVNCCQRMIDQSSFARPGSQGQFAGKTILEAVPDAASQYADLSLSDGVATDWLWVKPYGTSNLDLDRNGVNDYDEHGKSWVYSKWQEGTEQLLANLRAELDRAGTQKVALINYGFSFQNVGLESINGMVREWTTGFGGNFADGYFWNHEYQEFMEKAPLPHVALIDGRADRADPWVQSLEDTTEVRNHLQSMRYLLGVSLLGDAYFNFMTFEEATSTQNHHIHAWYDEFDADLGQAIDLGQPGPLDDAQELKKDLWVRFFKKGAAIVNTAGNPQIVTDSELRTLPGYAGPYWRFKGGQDIALNGIDQAMNNGEKFDQLTLGGYSYDKKGRNLIIGDAVILLNHAETIISDIIIDNRGFSTSPGSDPATLSAEFSQEMNDGRNHWSVFSHKTGRAYGGVDYWQTHARSDGGGEATFRPQISVSGNYQVFEWHGYMGQDPGDVQEATNTEFVIHHAGGSTTKSVDQSRDYGQWNSLGTYYFDQGTSGAVTLSASNADGPVSADAVKFVWQPEPSSSTFADVPASYWAHDYIETLYQQDFVAGCSAEPLLYCPDQSMNRAESAVFVLRGIHGGGYLPEPPQSQIFDDVSLDAWFAKWVEPLWNEGYTAGCGTDPLIYCPHRGHTRTEGTVFFLRMLHGASYEPPSPEGLFTDVPIDYWGTKWIEAAYKAGLIPACETDPEIKFCPHDPLTRAMGAYMMVQAKGLTLNE